MTQEKIITKTDAENLIEQVHLDAWKVNDLKYFLKKESAIEYLVTHTKCECGNLMKKGWRKCDECREKVSNENYSKLPFKEWDGNTPLCLFDENVYFFDEGSVHDYAEDNDLKIEDLQLCICLPNHLPEIQYYDLCDDILPEDCELEKTNPELMEKINELNEFIRNQKPISWFQGSFRTKI